MITIGRTAGEDRDNTATEGSYHLTFEESCLIETVCKYFDKTVVLLNTGNIIDMKWVQKYNPSTVLYVWQAGQEGGNGVLDILTGRISPSGKLADTIAIDCGATLCDVMGDMFDKQPDQMAVAEDAIQKQMQLIENLHDKGAEVLMSSLV